MKSKFIPLFAVTAFSIGFAAPSAWADEPNHEVRIEARVMGYEPGAGTVSDPDLSKKQGGGQEAVHWAYDFKNGHLISIDAASGAVVNGNPTAPSTPVRNLQLGSRFLKTPTQIEANARLVDETPASGISTLQAGARFNHKGGHTSVLLQGGLYWDRIENNFGYIAGPQVESEITPVDFLTLRAAVEAGLITGRNIDLGVAGRGLAGVRVNFEKEHPSFIELRATYENAQYKDLQGADVERSGLGAMVVFGISEGASSASDKQ
ncbi:hypothetical protein WDW86_10360 [Bdellovibrionota bacterium FG-2]